MLDTTERRSHLSAIGLSVAGQDYVIEVENTDPSRKVGERRKRNIIFEVAMARLGLVLQAESLSGEFLFLTGLDARTDVLAAFDQPISRKLTITDRNGKSTYTPDYLVIFHTRVCVYEIKADSELEALCKARPKDWVSTDSGYRYLPAERDFAGMGITYVVIANSELSAVLAANQRLLCCVRESTDTARLDKLRKKVIGVVNHEDAIRIGDILDRLEETDATPVLQLIERGQIFADLHSNLLADPRDIWVATSADRALAASDSDRFFASALKDEASLFEQGAGNPKYYGELARRYALVHGRAGPGPIETPIKKRRGTSQRSIRRYKQTYLHSAQNAMSLEPSWDSSGNREIRISPTHRAYVTGHIRAQRSDPNDQSVKAAFKSYKNSFEHFQKETELYHLKPVSRKYFYQLSHTANGRVKDAAGKGGRRLANAAQDPFDPSTKTLIATRPFEVAHIDHYLTDLHVVIGYRRGKKITRRAWLTAMVDGLTTEVLALWLGFASPSKKSCSMVIRDCVRRHGKCPEMIVVDSGSDFRSVHFEAMLAGIRVHRAERPVEDPKFGKEVERLFGILKEKCLRGLPGFGLSIEQSRKISAAFKAKANAELTLTDLARILCAFAFDGYNLMGFNSPGGRRADFARNLGNIGGREVAWDKRFLILTSIEAPSSDYTLWKGRGIRVYDRWYTSDELMRYSGFKKSISIKIEPFNTHLIYVCIDGTWITAWNAQKRLQEARSEQRVLAESAANHELRSLLAELANTADMELAELVERNLPQNVDPLKPPSKQPGKQRNRRAQSPPAEVELCFDDIEPLPMGPAHASS